MAENWLVEDNAETRRLGLSYGVYVANYLAGTTPRRLFAEPPKPKFLPDSPNKVCRICNAKIPANSRRSRYCSDKCAKQGAKMYNIAYKKDKYDQVRKKKEKTAPSGAVFSLPSIILSYADKPNERRKQKIP